MKKGIFGTLYVDSPTYRTYPSTTRKIEDAYKFNNLDKAEKIAKSFFGDVVELEEDDEDEPIIYCKKCIHYEDGRCKLNNEERKNNDFCSKAEKVE